MINFSGINITTDRLTLRPIQESDLQEVYAIFSDAQTMKYWSDPPLHDISLAAKKIKRNILSNQQGKDLTLAVELKTSKDLVGQISLFNIHKASARAEIGYVLSRTFWQQGLMKEAITAFISFCFLDLKMRRLEADIDPDNKASAALLSRMGFAKEGLLKERWEVGGLVTDSELYGLLKTTWIRDIAK